MLTPLIELLNSVYTETPNPDPEPKPDPEPTPDPDPDPEPDPDPDDEEKVSLKDYRKLRSEAASYRKALKSLEEKVDASTKAQEKATQDADIAKLKGIEAEKARTEQALKEVAEANTIIASKDARLKADAISTAVYRAANAAGFHKPEDAAQLLSLDGIDVTDGEVDQEEVTELVKTLAETSSYLLKGETADPEFGGGPSNPKDPKGGPKVKFTGAAEVQRLKQQAGELAAKGNMTAATSLYNKAWEMEHGVKGQ